MATQFTFCAYEPGSGAPHAAGATNEVVSESGTTAATTLTATAAQNVCRVAATANVYVSFGSAPNAGTDAARFMVPAGTTALFRIASGDKGAVITI